MKNSLAKIKELPAPYDLKAEIKDSKAEGYATEYGIAWIEGGRLQHRAQKPEKPVSDIPASTFVRCIRITKGAKWIISRRADVLHRLNGDKPISPNPDNPVALPQSFPEWLEDLRVNLNSLLRSACEADIFFNELWREKGEEIKTGEIGQLMVKNPIQSNLILTLHFAFQSLDRLEKGIDSGGEAFFFRAIKLGYEVGLRIQQLEAEVTNFQSMKMASQTSAGKKQSQRTEWLAAELDELEQARGRKAKTHEIIEHIENKIDPETKEAIWFQAREGDDEKVIQWGTNEVMTVKTFRDKISHIRNSRKKFFGR